jgi:hypothetical protein
MPRKEARIRIERGLYRSGDAYWACATPPGQRRAQWLKVGAVGIMEARRRRDEFAYKLASGGLPTRRKRTTVREVADDWFNHLYELVAGGQLRPRTVSSYKDGVSLHVLPTLASRQIGSIGPDDLLAWHEAQRRSGAATLTGVGPSPRVRPAAAATAIRTLGTSQRSVRRHRAAG